MRTLSIAPLLIVAAAFAIIPLAQGQSQTAPTVEQTPPTLDQAARSLNEHDDDAVASNCVRETGTRIPGKARSKDPKACQPGRAYDRSDIDRTGASSLADALQRLDPAVTIRRR